MVENVLDKARSLKKRAIALRNRGQLERALHTLDEAIALLEQARLQQEASDPATAELRAEMADTHGMKGGVFRRLGKLDAALQAYECGREIEAVDGQSTYNLSNVITLGVALKGRTLDDPKFAADLRHAIAHLEKEVAGPRGDEWWAWSDLAQFQLLLGQADKARASYMQGLNRAGPTEDEIARHVAILEELAQGSSEAAPTVAEDIRAAVRYLRPSSG